MSCDYIWENPAYSVKFELAVILNSSTIELTYLQV